MPNTLHGDGTLSPEPPGHEPPDVFLYNPLRPVPTLGGQVLLPGANAIGPRDQRPVGGRDDVLLYRRCVNSSARDTDFTGKLVDVYPDDRSIILTEGILRARYRNSTRSGAHGA
jgi:predicted acyl esterase